MTTRMSHSGQIWIHESWSGDMASVVRIPTKGVPVEDIGYWFPTYGKGPVGNDMIAVMANGQNPVLANMFCNYLLDLPNAIENYSYTGYMQPIEGSRHSASYRRSCSASNLTTTVVLPSYFRKGVMELELAPRLTPSGTRPGCSSAAACRRSNRAKGRGDPR